MMYDDASCTAPATSVRMWQDLSCVPQKDHYNPVCKPDKSGYSVSDCKDFETALDVALYQSGWQSYVLVSKYDGWCGGSDALDEAEAYSLSEVDRRCHTNRLGTTSSSISLDHSMLTYTTYSDPYCKEVSGTTQMQWSEIMGSMGNNCVNGTRIAVGGFVSTVSKVVAVFNESSCSGTPVKLTFTRGFDCIGGLQDPANSECGGDGSSLYSVSGCTSDDYSAYTMNAFGNYTPHLIMEGWDNSNCKGYPNVTVYTADGSCHLNTDGNTSFKATLTADSTAEITSYTDQYCGTMDSSMTVTKRQLISHACLGSDRCNSKYGCTMAFSVGGLETLPTSGLMTALVGFDEKSCTGVPVQTVVLNDRSCVISGAPTCVKVSSRDTSIFEYRECIDSVVAHANTVFNGVPYLVMENYIDGTNCTMRRGAVVYKADGKCHPSFTDGTYFKISPSIGNSLTFATYPTPSCSDFDADYVTVGSKYINADVCYEGKTKLYANVSLPTKPVMVDVDSMTREQIMFPDWLWEPRPRRVFESD
ncbi:hypothetical protein PF005_g20158 [Phytophthora fragariae]|nr:hypothetical protein PF005_g20158 [Phytophthora fragariae]